LLQQEDAPQRFFGDVAGYAPSFIERQPPRGFSFALVGMAHKQ